ncbi:MAG: hypothetical protein ACYSYU_06630 [Planctomycetota bacterium]|jgi:hypothetical protein
MDLNEIYTLVNYISNKHKSGNAFTPNEFNSLIEILNHDFFKKKVEESGYFNQDKLSKPKAELYASKFMRSLIVNETVSTSGSLTYAYAYWLGAHDSGNNVEVDLITEAEYHDRIADSVMVPSANAVCAVERATEIDVYPASVLNINISYLRYPDTPFLDYYFNTTGYIQFLAAGATHVWATGEIDSARTTHTVGDGNWTSLTVELEFPTDMHSDFMNDILSRVGIRLKEAQITQAAEQWKAEQKQM